MMKNIIFAFSMVISLMVAPTALAKQKPFPMSAGSVIEVDSWDPETKTYEVTNTKYPGQGPLIVTPEEFARTVLAVKLSKIQRAPDSILKNQYKTDKVMMLLPPELVEARREKKAKEKN